MGWVGLRVQPTSLCHERETAGRKLSSRPACLIKRKEKQIAVGGEALLQGRNGLCTGLPWLVLSQLAWSQCGGAEAEKRSLHLCCKENLRDATGVWRRRWLDVAVAGAFWKESWFLS
ncbi:hypothetical protein NC651_015245 [Populus alba x Populus x berolinensis]|nr:hypothetical protein NC651_015245 [Populus alba x Populus x berolinensis]